jgi:hypothetical protein
MIGAENVGRSWQLGEPCLHPGGDRSLPVCAVRLSKGQTGQGQIPTCEVAPEVNEIGGNPDIINASLII